MRKAMLMLTAAFLAVGVMFTPVAADWHPEDGHKMHFPQLPDEAGWDVNATVPLVLADDWTCSESGLIRDVHFWGSWMHGVEGVVDSFVIGFAQDIPASQSPTGYSMPGATIVEYVVSAYTAVPIDPPTMEGWYNPYTGEIFPDDHDAYFQYNIFLDELYPEQELIWQDEGTVYWLFISAWVNDVAVTQWGWKSSLDHYLDDAVWAEWFVLDWKELYEPAEPKMGAFGATMLPDGTFTGWGDPAYNNQWYYYENTEWWNVWFYDDPFDESRIKIIHIEFDVFPVEPGGEAFFELALNWSTDLWSIEQPAGDSAPPLPPLSPDDELRYIGRKSLFASEMFEGHYVFEDTIWDYNPEWVSIDIRGFNFDLNGIILHSCVVSMDMSFVITGGEELIGACCYSPSGGPDLEACIETTVADCDNLGGTYYGDGTQCQGVEACCLANGDCIDADALCCVNELGGTPQGPGSNCTAPEACCLTGVTVDQCIEVDPLCCDEMGGVPQGQGTHCSVPEACCLTGVTVDQCIEVDPLCCDEMGGIPQGQGTHCTAPEACCLQDGQCIEIDPLCCDELGGTPQGLGTHCTALEACCLSITVAGECRDLDPLCCVQLGGAPQGVGTHCTQPEACCLQGGAQCSNVDPLCCDELGGTVGLTGGPCLGDNDVPPNGIDDACESVEELKWQQPPDISEMGMDVYANFPEVVLADDFECTAYGPITRIRIWASWFMDQYPMGDPGNVMFYLSLHTDIPAALSPTGYSMPGEMLWQRPFGPGEFHYDLYEMHPEGFYNPLTGMFEPFGDTECWEYVFYLNEGEFTQQGSPGTPVVYWLNVQAEVMDPGMVWFGWKTSSMHWNDDAVWFNGVDPVPPGVDWNELRYPPGHPYAPESIDLAFEIYFEATDCCIPPIRGDIDLSDGIIDIADLVYLVDYMFNAGPPPPCFEEADVDASGVAPIDIADLVYLVDYMFNSGPIPPPCP